MCLLLPCCAGTAWASWRVNRSLDKTFNKPPEAQGESAIVTEAKLTFKVCVCDIMENSILPSAHRSTSRHMKLSFML